MKNLLQMVEKDKPRFADDPLIYLDPNEQRFIDMFTETYSESDHQSVNVQEVTGTTRPDYGDKTWLYLLNNGKRIKDNLKMFEDNPAYYAEDKRKNPPIVFIMLERSTDLWSDFLSYRFNSDIYQKKIFMEHGNERTCITRFASYYSGSTFMKGAQIKKYVINVRLMAFYEYMNRWYAN